MFCKNCGTQLNENDLVCPKCNTNVSDEPSKENENNFSQNNTVNIKEQIILYAKKIKEKLNLKSIFDDSITRSPLEKKISSKYFFIMICTFILIFFWSANTMHFSIPLTDEFELVDYSTSLKQLFSGVSWIKGMLNSSEGFVQDYFDGTELQTVKNITLILSIIVFIYNFATLCIFISPLFMLFPLFQRSVNKGIWLTLETVCLLSSFVIHFGFFILLKLGVMLIGGGLSDVSSSKIDFNLGLNFNSLIFIFVFGLAFAFIILAKKDLAKSRIPIMESQTTEELI